MIEDVWIIIKFLLLKLLFFIYILIKLGHFMFLFKENDFFLGWENIFYILIVSFIISLMKNKFYVWMNQIIFLKTVEIIRIFW